MRTCFLLLTLFLMTGCSPKVPLTATPNSLPTPESPMGDQQSLPSPSPNATGAETSQTDAPALVVLDQNGQSIDFGELYKKGPVLVYFYPKADTPGCTAQACSLRDSYEKLTDSGLTVIGVSTDNPEAQKAFQEKYHLPFVLIPDPNKVVLEAFGVASMGGMANREAFLIKDGKIDWHDASASTDKQADDVIAQMASWKS